MICLLAGALYFWLVVSHVFAVAILIVWVRLEKSKWLNLDVKNNFKWSHNEHSWRSSYEESWLTPLLSNIEAIRVTKQNFSGSLHWVRILTGSVLRIRVLIWDPSWCWVLIPRMAPYFTQVVDPQCNMWSKNKLKRRIGKIQTSFGSSSINQETSSKFTYIPEHQRISSVKGKKWDD